VKVTLPYDKTWEPLDWAKKNCPSYITNAFASPISPSSTEDTIFIDYFFREEKDAMFFTLRWA